MLQFLFRRLLIALKWFAIASILLVLLFRWVPPPGTALMVERKIESWTDGQPIDLQRTWKPWDQISDELKVAVMAGEDQKFPEHWGFDLGLRLRRDPGGPPAQRARRLDPWRQHPQPAGGKEPVPLVRPQLSAQGTGSLVHRADRDQASLLAAVLPNPREWSASHPSTYVARRAGWIRQQMSQLGGTGYLAGLNDSRKAPWAR